VNKKTLIGIIAACTVVIVVAIVLVVLKPWEGAQTYTLTTFVNPPGTGAVSLSGGQFESGTQVITTAIPTSGYTFYCWTGGVSDTSPTISFTMNHDYSITANFQEQEEEAVTYHDPNLEAAIREAVGIPEETIYAEDLEGLTALAADGRNIADLSGLEHCTDLTHISLSHNPIGDISSLTNLTNLTTIYLEDSQISDVSPLANLTNLTWLDLSNNQIGDISPLANLTSLTTLKLSNNQIGYTAYLANLTNLAELDLNDNQVSDISPLEGLVSLTMLWLHGNQLSDISPLINLTNPAMLGLMNNQISDISPLLDNPGLGDGDDVILVNNPLSEESVNVHIPELETRGVTVEY
jgi:uncharacterized repeat protein (TIGR02543 family)